MITKPMLAGKCSDITNLTYPLLATPKLDGIRCLMINGKAVSRKFKPIPNKFIRAWIERNARNEYDGEIMIKGRCFDDLSGDVRREDGEPDFQYWVFDYVKDSLTKPYIERIKDLTSAPLRHGQLEIQRMRRVLPFKMNNAEELTAFEEKCLSEGYEGVMVRSPNSPYKCGRSTENEGYLLKIKRFEDDEAKIIGYEEMMHNENEATRDALGR